jgi:hypothetical protein
LRNGVKFSYLNYRHLSENLYFKSAFSQLHFADHTIASSDNGDMHPFLLSQDFELVRLVEKTLNAATFAFRLQRDKNFPTMSLPIASIRPLTVINLPLNCSSAVVWSAVYAFSSSTAVIDITA